MEYTLANQVPTLPGSPLPFCGPRIDQALMLERLVIQRFILASAAADRRSGSCIVAFLCHTMIDSTNAKKWRLSEPNVKFKSFWPTSHIRELGRQTHDLLLFVRQGRFLSEAGQLLSVVDTDRQILQPSPSLS
jgi:hypothetical protein